MQRRDGLVVLYTFGFRLSSLLNGACTPQQRCCYKFPPRHHRCGTDTDAGGVRLAAVSTDDVSGSVCRESFGVFKGGMLICGTARATSSGAPNTEYRLDDTHTQRSAVCPSPLFSLPPPAHAHLSHRDVSHAHIIAALCLSYRMTLPAPSRASSAVRIPPQLAHGGQSFVLFQTGPARPCGRLDHVLFLTPAALAFRDFPRPRCGLATKR
ncbi:hypothetical protein B0H10DRAFT_2191257 [Mycena sp. CBHHK59/15]|nr:hypothetical protein B0H10DRAFT_2191257 [Mycena sp. CBHHK59/15]